MATYQDTFTRAAGNLAGSTSSDGLFTWSVPDGTDPQTNGTAISRNAGGPSWTGMASADCDSDSMYVEVDAVLANTSAVIWLDINSNGTYPGAGSSGYEAALFGGNAQIFAINNGTFTQLGATAAHSPSTGTYRFEKSGTTLTLFRNGVSIISRTDSSEPTGAGRRRAGAGGDPTGANIAFNEFRYGDVAGGSAPTVAQELPAFLQSLSGNVIGRVDA